MFPLVSARRGHLQGTNTRRAGRDATGSPFSSGSQLHSEGLHDALAAATASHADSCDLTDPSTPCAAVGILRIGAETVDTLALSDVTMLVENSEGPEITCDLSIEISGTGPAAVAGLLFNTPEHKAALAALVGNQTRTPEPG